MTLFKNNIEPCCSYCSFGNRISDDEIMCLKKGIVSPAGQCKKFRYDPLRREPPVHTPINTDDLSAEDFAIE